MALVVIYAQAPWGPISLRTAESTANLLARGVQPAAVVDVGERDPADVVKVALRLLPPPMDATGQIPATVEKARNSVMESILRVPARVVAAGPGNAVSGKPVSHCGAMASDGEAEPAFPDQDAPVPALDVEVPTDAGMNANERIAARVRRRPGQEIDAREIRTKLGMSQPEFARTFGLKVATVRDWDQGRTSPDGAARSLLLLIEHRPTMVKDVLARYGVPVAGE